MTRITCDVSRNGKLRAGRSTTAQVDTERRATREAFPRPLCDSLATFAVRMATLAVRERSPDRIFLGLAALALVDSRRDYREIIMRLAPLHDAACRIGAEPDALFERTAAIASPQGAERFRAFARRHPDLQSLRMMGYGAEEPPDGFRYVFRPGLTAAR